MQPIIYLCLTLLIRNITGRWPPPTPQTLSKRAMLCFMVIKTLALSKAALVGLTITNHNTCFEALFSQLTLP